MRLYRAIKRICKEEKLSAVTVSCFKLIERTGTTGCLALAMLNDEGIIAGCEGDLQSVFTLLVAKALTGKVGFMANPSMINARNNEIILAHCTIGMKQTERYIIRNHFETRTATGRRCHHCEMWWRMPGRILPVYRNSDRKHQLHQYVPYTSTCKDEYTGRLFPEKPTG